MRRNLLWAFFMSPLFLAAQDRGVSFVHGLSWAEILQKAKTENKYVFVDCYTTWCGPCKYMDNEVYSRDTVGALMNDRYISVKIQMDTTTGDNEEAQRWYSTAHTISEQYNITGYPSYLFFSPDGNALHKAMGARAINDFLSLTKSALDPDKQFYTLLANYQRGARNFAQMAVLTDEAARNHQDSLACQVGRDYIHHYLETLQEERLWTRDNIAFFNSHPEAIQYGDGILRSYCQHQKQIDSIMNKPSFSNGLLNTIIYRDRIRPNLEKGMRTGNDPNWHRLEKEITQDYDAYFAHINVLRGQVDYYKARKKWDSYVNYYIQQQEANGIETLKPGDMTEVELNNDAFEVFQHSRNRRQLEKVLPWVDRAIAMAAAMPADKFWVKAEAMDTKANILYKLGRKKEGFALEEQSHALSPRDRDITANYQKMKSGLPTWPAE